MALVILWGQRYRQFTRSLRPSAWDGMAGIYFAHARYDNELIGVIARIVSTEVEVDANDATELA